MFLNVPFLASEGEQVGVEKQKEKKTVPGSNHQSVTTLLFCPEGNFSSSEKTKIVYPNTPSSS